MRDPGDRRFGHPFITCTNCGPRYTVIVDLPYDRDNSTMASFGMCASCRREFDDPGDRRYHAQTIACPQCGPQLRWRANGAESADGDPIDAAAEALRAGRIVAIKGIGGFHLACRADRRAPVVELRRRKARPLKPFAVMVADLHTARMIADVGDVSAGQLNGPAAPIVLAGRRGGRVVDLVVGEVAPGLSDIGIMLPYSPIQHLLFDRLGSVPLVMTSANRSGSPIVFSDDDRDVLDALADGALVHDRPIHVPCEDSVITVDPDGSVIPLRRSRGYTPLPISIPVNLERQSGVVLATGGDIKTTLCLLAANGNAYLSSYLGDMADPDTQERFEGSAQHLARITNQQPEVIACDMHPRYATGSWARRRAGSRRVVAVQHHHAHAVALLAEHQRLDDRIVAVAYDGSGYGTDGSIWGGELLAVDGTKGFARVGHLYPFALPGGQGAIRQPARIALDLLWRTGLEWAGDLAPVNAVSAADRDVLAQQIPGGFGCVATTSMGRLLDAVASLLDVCQQVTYEGQAAVELEHLARSGRPTPKLTMDVCEGVIDPRPMFVGLVNGLRAGVETADLAAAAHEAVIEATAVAVAACAVSAGIETIGLTGGVFANRMLRLGLQRRLCDAGLEVLTHRSVPCNDGGLALGQAVIAACTMHRGAARDPMERH
jgi:hydrogenase maturation protein HypF